MKLVNLRQGDVFFKGFATCRADLPGDVTVETSGQEVTVALGEATGHHHTLYALHQNAAPVTLWRNKDRRFIEVPEGYEFRHQEHGPIPVPAAIYEILDEREFDPFKNLAVKVLD